MSDSKASHATTTRPAHRESCHSYSQPVEMALFEVWAAGITTLVIQYLMLGEPQNGHTKQTYFLIYLHDDQPC